MQAQSLYLKWHPTASSTPPLILLPCLIFLSKVASAQRKRDKDAREQERPPELPESL